MFNPVKYFRIRSDFWVKRILSRIVVVILFGYATYNPIKSWTQWAADEIHTGVCSGSGFRFTDHLGFTLVTLCIIGGWSYVLGKAWRGVGQSLIRGGLFAAMLIALFMLMMNHGLIPNSYVWATIIVETLMLFGIGASFTLILIDRQFSGTSTASVMVDHDTHATDFGHHGG